jgi:hypothetical protein
LLRVESTYMRKLTMGKQSEDKRTRESVLFWAQEKRWAYIKGRGNSTRIWKCVVPVKLELMLYIECDIHSA